MKGDGILASEVVWTACDHILLAVCTHMCPCPHLRIAHSSTQRYHKKPQQQAQWITHSLIELSELQFTLIQMTYLASLNLLILAADVCECTVCFNQISNLLLCLLNRLRKLQNLELMSQRKPLDTVPVHSKSCVRSCKYQSKYNTFSCFFSCKKGSDCHSTVFPVCLFLSLASQQQFEQTVSTDLQCWVSRTSSKLEWIPNFRETMDLIRHVSIFQSIKCVFISLLSLSP